MLVLVKDGGKIYNWNHRLEEDRFIQSAQKICNKHGNIFVLNRDGKLEDPGYNYYYRGTCGDFAGYGNHSNKIVEIDCGRKHILGLTDGEKITWDN